MKDALSCLLTQCQVLAKSAYILHFIEALRIDSFGGEMCLGSKYRILSDFVQPTDFVAITHINKRVSTPYCHL